jgi:glycosyltransferase involved in cell wall biosynthesis
MSFKEPLISVIIPCYNVSNYVSEAINSIIKQTYRNLEIWVIDDASSDGTLDKIKAIKDDRIIIETFKINTKKIGAVNEVLKKVNGDFICFQDSDDWSEPSRIELQMNEFQKHPKLGVCFTKYCYVGKSRRVPEKIALTNEELKDEFVTFGNKKNKNFEATTCGTMMIAKEVLRKNNGYHPYFTGRVGEDIYWIYTILKEYDAVTINTVLYNYRMREGSFTQIQQQGQNVKAAYSWQLISMIIENDVKHNIDLLDSSNVELLKVVELEACEKALLEKIKQLISVQNTYEKSTSFRIGKTILAPFKFLKRSK